MDTDELCLTSHKLVMSRVLQNPVYMGMGHGLRLSCNCSL